MCVIMRRKKAKLTDIRAGRVGKWGGVKLRSQLAVGALTFMLAFGVDVAPVYALSAADVVDKTAGVQIETAAAATNITAPDKAIINWNKFNIASGETVNFIQPNVSAMVLNRVQAGGGVSEILGMLNANGNVFLINPNGVLFGAGSQVNAAGLVVSTANITDENFKNGKLIFEQDNKTNANIIINGTLNAETNGEYVKSVLNVEALPKVTGITSINNIIKIVADGDIIVGGTGSLQAVTTTQVEGDGTVGQESFAVEGADSIAEGKIILRADANADDLADYHQSLYEENVYEGGH